MLKKVLMVVGVFYCTVGSIHAQLSELDLFTQDKVVVVTATKTEQTLQDAPGIMSVYLSKEIQRLPYSELIDFLNLVPGFVVSMGPDGKYRITVRAQRAPGEVLVLIDGQKINDVYTGEGNYEIPVEWIDRIEVLRGPASALFGTNALTGIINIITKQPDPDKKGKYEIKQKSTIMFGNGINKGIRFYGGYNTGLFRIDANIKMEDPWGMKVERDIYSDSDPNSLLYGGKIRYTYRKFTGANVKGSFKKDRLSMTALWFYKKHDAYSGYTLYYTPGSDLKENSIIGNISYTLLKKERVNSYLKIGGLYVLHDYLIKERPDGYIDPVSGDTFYDGMLTKEYFREYSVNVENQFNYFANKNLTLVVGLQYELSAVPIFSVERNYSVISHNYFGALGNYDSLSFGNLKNKKRQVFAGYAQLIYKNRIKDVNWKVVLGGRYDRYSDLQEKIPFVPRLTFMVSPLDNLTFRIMYGGAFRAPTFKELYDRSSIGADAIYGNIALKSEEITTPEFGVEWRLKRGVVRWNAYKSNLKNIIRTFDPQGSGKYGWYENIGNIKSYGTELSLRYALTDYLGIMTNYSYVLPVFYWNYEKLGRDFLASIGAFDGTWIRNVPHYRANLGVNIKGLKDKQGYRLIASAIVKYFGKRSNNSRLNIETQHPVSIKDAITMDINFSYRLTPRMVFSLQGYNLLPTYYADPVETSDIDSYGDKGLIQPARKIGFEFKINI